MRKKVIIAILVLTVLSALYVMLQQGPGQNHQPDGVEEVVETPFNGNEEK